MLPRNIGRTNKLQAELEKLLTQQDAFTVFVLTMNGIARAEGIDEQVPPDLVDQVEPFEGIFAAVSGHADIVSELPIDLGLLDGQQLKQDVAIVVQDGFAALVSLDTLREGYAINSDRKRISLDSQLLVIFNGQFGFFDLGNSEEDDDTSREILLLREEVLLLRRENQMLRADMDAARKAITDRDNQVNQLNVQIAQMIADSQRSPEDFAMAISQSVDLLQTRLSGLSNTISDFVVREFDLEAKVYVDVNPTTRQIDYRFLRPGDNVDAQKVSNLSLKLVPVPKREAENPQPEGTITQPLAVELPLENIDGMGEETRALFARNGIFTVAELLQTVNRARLLAQIEGLSAVERDRLANWVNQAQLMILGGIDTIAAQILIEMGMINPTVLATADAEEILTRFNAAATNGDRHKPVTQEVVQGWIDQAKRSIGSL
jgi:predicted flap endonuclease-1-like 5' DNA nuclease